LVRFREGRRYGTGVSVHIPVYLAPAPRDSDELLYDFQNLELTEMRLFLEYVYVRLLDVIDVVTDLADRAEAKCG